MKFNHFCLLAGIVLIVLSLSVFANAACSVPIVEESPCSACSFCTNPSTCPQPVCGATLNSCTNGNFVDVNDSSTQFKWKCNTNTGATVSCTLNKPCEGVCGSEVNSCDSGDFVDGIVLA